MVGGAGQKPGGRAEALPHKAQGVFITIGVSKAHGRSLTVAVRKAPVRIPGFSTAWPQAASITEQNEISGAGVKHNRATAH